jgi:membrane protein implicated in regulation of membrane protease activity
MSLLDKARLVHPTLQKVLGVVFVLVGIFALVTPLTPGSWLALIGLELLGIRILFLDKIYAWWKVRKENKTKQK